MSLPCLQPGEPQPRASPGCAPFREPLLQSAEAHGFTPVLLRAAPGVRKMGSPDGDVRVFFDITIGGSKGEAADYDGTYRLLCLGVW
jgi:hypothetical protein